MEYVIELFFDLKKVKNIALIKDLLVDLAHNCNCSMQYFIHEIDGHSRIIDNNTCIYYINFCEENFIYLINMIQIIRENKSELFKNIIIDCIYEDGESNQIIYASQNYIKSIDKNQQEKIKILNNFNKSNIENIYHKKILEAINK